VPFQDTGAEERNRRRQGGTDNTGVVAMAVGQEIMRPHNATPRRAETSRRRPAPHSVLIRSPLQCDTSPSPQTGIPFTPLIKFHPAPPTSNLLLPPSPAPPRPRPLPDPSLPQTRTPRSRSRDNDRPTHLVRRERLAGEVLGAGGEASFDQTGVEAHEVLHLGGVSDVSAGNEGERSGSPGSVRAIETMSSGSEDGVNGE
jgi:hypothetical protein